MDIKILLLLLLVTPVMGLNAADIDRIDNKTRGFFDGVDPTIVEGSSLSIAQRTLYRGIIAQNNELRQFPRVSDAQYVEGPRVLLGGPNTNVQSFLVKPNSTLLVAGINITYYDEERVMMIASRKEVLSADKSITKSPLARFMPAAAVPVVASLFSLLLMLFFQFLAGTATSVGKTAAAIMAGTWWKQRVQEKQAKRHLFIMPLREAVTILLVILVLTAAKTWAYSPGWLQALIVAGVTTTLLTLVRETARIFWARKHHVHVESVFWPLGALLTLVSAYLGNLFSLPSYLRIHKDEKKQWARVSLNVAYVTMAVAFVTWLLEFWIVNQYVHTLSVVAATVAFISLLPIKPLAGLNIWKFNKKLWTCAFVLAFILYILIVFVFSHFA